MIQFLPERFISGISRWKELLIYLLSTLFIIFILFEINFWGIISSRTYTNNDIWMFLSIGLFLFLLYNFNQTSTIVDEIVIDYSRRIVSISYSYYYFITKKCEISFDVFSFRYFDTLGISIPYISVLIFSNNNEVVKIVSSNGWKKRIVKEIIIEFNKIKPTKKSRDHGL
jgi:hypothetical protein